MYKMKNDILSPGLVPMKITGKNQLTWQFLLHTAPACFPELVLTRK